MIEGIERVGAIKLIDVGEFFFEGGRQTKSGLPIFEGPVTLTVDQQIDLAVILRRKGEKEFLRIGSIDFAFYFKEAGRCNLVVKDHKGGAVSVFPLNSLEQEELRTMTLYSLYRQNVSAFIEGSVVFKEAESSSVEIDSVLIDEEECFRLARAMELEAYYECRRNGIPVVRAGLQGYALGNYWLSSENSFKLQVIFESATLFTKPQVLYIERPVAGE